MRIKSSRQQSSENRSFRQLQKRTDLNDGGENEAEAEEDEVVEGRRIGHFGKRGARLQAQERHGQHGGDAQRDAVRGGLAVQPKRDPGQDHQQDARAVHLDQERARVPAQPEHGRQHRVLPCCVHHQ